MRVYSALGSLRGSLRSGFVVLYSIARIEVVFLYCMEIRFPYHIPGSISVSTRACHVIVIGMRGRAKAGFDSQPGRWRSLTSLLFCSLMHDTCEPFSWRQETRGKVQRNEETLYQKRRVYHSCFDSLRSDLLVLLYSCCGFLAFF